MARIFISYSRVDKAVTTVLVDRLRKVYGHDAVWYDDSLYAGDIWWEEILDQIAACDIFIYLLSNESVTSPYCQAEFAEAQRLQKRIITVQVRDRTALTGNLGDIHYVDMKTGPDSTESYDLLIASINKQAERIKKHRPKWKGRTPRPDNVDLEPESVSRTEITTPDLRPPEVARKSNERLWLVRMGVIVAIMSLIVAVVALWDQLSDGGSPAPLPTTAVALADTVSNTFTPTPTETSTPTASPTRTPTLSGTQVEQTIQAEMAAIQAEGALTAAAQQTATTQSVTAQVRGAADLLTATALMWTPTPTPNARQTAEVRLTQTQAAVFAQATVDAQMTLDALATADSNATTFAQETVAAQATMATIMPDTPLGDGPSTPDDSMVTAIVNANVRSGDSIESGRIGVLLIGDSAPIIGRSSNGSGWFYIELPDGTRGWIAPSVVTVGDTSDVPQFELPYVTAKLDANVRASDRVNADRVGTLLRGDSALVIGLSSRENGWIYIELSYGGRGWIAPSVVSRSGYFGYIPSIDPENAP